MTPKVIFIFAEKEFITQGLLIKEFVMDDTQMMMNVAITKEALDFEAGMSAALINGTIQKGLEMQESLARIAGLQAQGIGCNLNISV